MQPLFQQCRRSYQRQKITGGGRDQQGGGENLHGHAGTMEHPGQSRNADAGQQRHKGIHLLHAGRGGGTGVGVHKVLYIALSPQNAGALGVVLRLFDKTCQGAGFAHGVQLHHFGGAGIVARQQCHHHLQHKGGAEGNPLLVQAEPGICHTGDKGDG